MSNTFILLALFNAAGSWVFAAHPTSVLLHAAGRYFSTLKCASSRIPVKIKKLIMRSDCQLDRRNWIGFNWILQPRLTSLSAAFPRILGYTSAQAAGPPLLGSIHLLLPVCKHEFCHFRIFQGVFSACCPLPKDLSVVFLWTENSLPWVCFQSSLEEFGCLKPPCSCISLSSGCAVFHNICFIHVHSSERELLDCVTFSACRAKGLSQKEPKIVCTSQVWLIHCYLPTCMRGFYLERRVFHIPCNNSENCVNKSAEKLIYELTLEGFAVDGCTSERFLQCWWLALNTCIALSSKLNIFKSQYFFCLKNAEPLQEHFLNSCGRAEPDN